MKQVDETEQLGWSHFSLLLTTLQFLFLFFSPSFWLFHMVCGVLVPQPGTEHISPAMEALSLNHWAAKQVPILQFLTQTGGSVNVL